MASMGLAVARGNLVADTVAASDAARKEYAANAGLRDKQRAISFIQQDNAMKLAELQSRVALNEEQLQPLMQQMYTNPEAAGKVMSIISGGKRFKVVPGAKNKGIYSEVTLQEVDPAGNPVGEAFTEQLVNLETVVSRFVKSVGTMGSEASTWLSEKEKRDNELAQAKIKAQAELEKAQAEATARRIEMRDKYLYEQEGAEKSFTREEQAKVNKKYLEGKKEVEDYRDSNLKRLLQSEQFQYFKGDDMRPEGWYKDGEMLTSEQFAKVYDMANRAAEFTATENDKRFSLGQPLLNSESGLNAWSNQKAIEELHRLAQERAPGTGTARLQEQKGSSFDANTIPDYKRRQIEQQKSFNIAGSQLRRG